MRRRTMVAGRVTGTRAVAGAALALLAAGAGFGCFSEHAPATAPGGSLDGECRIPVGSPIVGGTQAIVAIRNFAFVPDTVRVRPGTTVTWINCESEGVDAHTATSQTGVWDSPFLEPGGTYSHTFEAAGRFGYFCIPHPFMRGAVVVE